jgi:hypothetical protein
VRKVIEGSLAQTGCGLSEQNERAHPAFELDLLSSLADRFDNPHFVSRRRAAAKYLIDSVFVEEDIVEVRRLDRAGWSVCNLYESLGDLQAQSRWNSLAWARAYGILCDPAIENLREEWKDPS